MTSKFARYLAFFSKWFSCSFVAVIVYEAIALKWLAFASEPFAHLSGITIGWIVLDELLNGPMWKRTKLREDE
jgi:hypothetical protein